VYAAEAVTLDSLTPLIDFFGVRPGTGKVAPFIDQILPIQRIPATKIRMALSACYTRAAVERYVPAFVTSDADYKIYTSAGRLTGNGTDITFLLSEEFRKNGRISTILNLRNLPFEQLGTNFYKAWIAEARLDGHGEVIFAVNDELPEKALGATFTRLTNQEQVIAYQAPAGKQVDDRLFFDPGRPNPCATPTPTPSPTPFATVSPNDATATHIIGTSPCPDLGSPGQLITTITIRNLGKNPIDLFANEVHPALDIVASTNIIEPGQTATVLVYFNCNQQESFQAPVRITLIDRIDNRTQEQDIPITMNIVP